MRGGETGSAEGEEEEGDLEAIATAEVVDETSGAGSGAVNVEPSGEISSGGTRPPDRMVLKRDLREEMDLDDDTATQPEDED
jgi:hypothetical protein